MLAPSDAELVGGVPTGGVGATDGGDSTSGGQGGGDSAPGDSRAASPGGQASGGGAGDLAGSAWDAGAGGEQFDCGGTCCDQSVIPPTSSVTGFAGCKTSLVSACTSRGGLASVLVDDRTVEQQVCRHCRVECCDASVLELTAYADAATCFSSGPTLCGADGPASVEYNGAPWPLAILDCPSNRDCDLTCCNGDEITNRAISEASCVEHALADRFCEGKGGRQRVDFAAVNVWAGDTCADGAYDCVSTCCDGSRSYGNYGLSNECAFFGGFACQDDGGPNDITFQAMSVFTPDVACPTARSCILRCCDGFEIDRSPAFSNSGCIFFNAATPACEEASHGTNRELLFGGESIWTQACP